LDLLTPFGTAEETWAALLAGRCIEDHAAARATLQTDDVSRVAQLARIAANGACQHTSAPERAWRDTALVIGTSKGSVVEWLRGAGPGPELLADIAGHVARDLGIGGPRVTVSAACASGLVALIRGAMMIESGEARRVIVVAAEASLHPLFLASFARLGVLPPPGHGCRPFDASRRGFLMSEAAAAVVLEASDPAGGVGAADAAAIYVDRYAFGGDATHLTGSDPDGRLLRRLLSRVIDGRPVDLVHAHGTGTEMNDAAEIAALDDCLPPGVRGHRAVLYSHKAALGHSLGASGLVSVVLNCLAHREGNVPPNPQTTQPLPSRLLQIRPQAVRRGVTRSLAVAAGFGGATAVVALMSE
jgi:3-oxoacyl-[acyl-carrier-protein] synthase II